MSLGFLCIIMNLRYEDKWYHIYMNMVMRREDFRFTFDFRQSFCWVDLLFISNSSNLRFRLFFHQFWEFMEKFLVMLGLIKANFIVVTTWNESCDPKLLVTSLGNGKHTEKSHFTSQRPWEQTIFDFLFLHQEEW